MSTEKSIIKIYREVSHPFFISFSNYDFFRGCFFAGAFVSGGFFAGVVNDVGLMGVVGFFSTVVGFLACVGNFFSTAGVVWLIGGGSLILREGAEACSVRAGMGPGLTVGPYKCFIAPGCLMAYSRCLSL